MDKEELLKLQAFLRQSTGCDALKVVPHARKSDEAEVRLGEKRLGGVLVDDEDEDRSYSFSMPIPAARDTLQSYLRNLLGNEKLRISGRLKKSDSVELSNGDEFLGVISADDAKGTSWTLEMAVLDFDLEDL